MSFKLRLKELRRTEDYTQEELSSKLKISRSGLSAYERGVREPDLETLERIADYFNVDMDYLKGKSEVRRKYDYETIAAHHVGEVWTEEELK